VAAMVRVVAAVMRDCQPDEIGRLRRGRLDKTLSPRVLLRTG
jgi:hypothetical protein